jgi:hypothetical protein
MRTFPGPAMEFAYRWNGLNGVMARGWFPDGSFLMNNSINESDYPPGRAVVSQQWHLFDAEGTHQGLFAVLPWGHTNNEGEGASVLEFSLRASTWFDATGLWHGLHETVELSHYTRDGIDRIVRTDYVPPPVPERAKDLVRERLEGELARLRSDPQFKNSPAQLQEQALALQQGRLDQLTFAERLPAFRYFIVSRDGHFWVAHYFSPETVSDRAWHERTGWIYPTHWTVLSPEGEWLGTVETPEDLFLREVTGDRIIGVRRDEMDVETVEVYRLVKP